MPKQIKNKKIKISLKIPNKAMRRQNNLMFSQRKREDQRLKLNFKNRMKYSKIMILQMMQILQNWNNLKFFRIHLKAQINKNLKLRQSKCTLWNLTVQFCLLLNSLWHKTNTSKISWGHMKKTRKKLQKLLEFILKKIVILMLKMQLELKLKLLRKIILQ